MVSWLLFKSPFLFSALVGRRTSRVRFYLPLRFSLPLLFACSALPSFAFAQQELATGPAPTETAVAQLSVLPEAPSSLLAAEPETTDASSSDGQATGQQAPNDPTPQDKPHPRANGQYDVNGNLIPLERQQPTRILGFMPNFRSVSGGAVAHPPGWKYNFTVATHQAFDYSSFIFLGLTTISAEGLNEHPVLGKGVHGFYSYGWRGFLDKTDGNYLGGWFLPSLLHEDTRYYAKGPGHSIVYRSLYVLSRQVVTRTYGEHDTPNIAGLGGKVLAQVVSRTYYPTGATSFGVLAEKFGYATMRDVAFTSIREFYPDIAAHYIRKHRAKMARMAAADATAARSQSSPSPH